MIQNMGRSLVKGHCKFLRHSSMINLKFEELWAIV